LPSLKNIKETPHITYTETFDHLKKYYGVQIKDIKLFRSLKEARGKVERNCKEKYGLVWDYVVELLKSNLGTTTKSNITSVLECPPQFNKFYVHLDACKR